MQSGRFSSVFRRAPMATLIAVVLATGIAVSAGAVVTARQASDHIASAAFGKLGSNPQEVLNTIADRVVKKLSAQGGVLNSAQEEIVGKITGIAADKFKDVDLTKALNDLKGQVNPQQIVDRVTQALIAQAMVEVHKIDLKALVGAQVNKLDVNAVVNKLMSGIDVNKLVKEELDKVDLNALIKQVIEDKMSSGGSGGLLGGLLGKL